MRHLYVWHTLYAYLQNPVLDFHSAHCNSHSVMQLGKNKLLLLFFTFSAFWQESMGLFYTHPSITVTNTFLILVWAFSLFWDNFPQRVPTTGALELYDALLLVCTHNPLVSSYRGSLRHTCALCRQLCSSDFEIYTKTQIFFFTDADADADADSNSMQLFSWYSCPNISLSKLDCLWHIYFVRIC